MISIYLCDDEESVRHQFKTALEWKIFIDNYDMRVVCAASTAQELLDMAQDSRRGVYFLDVDLKDEAWDGFALGRELRRRDPHGTLGARIPATAHSTQLCENSRFLTAHNVVSCAWMVLHCPGACRAV